MASSFWIVVLAAPAATQDIRDWPCDAPLVERFDPVQIWGGPLPTPLPEGCRQNAAVREVVAFAANPENPQARRLSGSPRWPLGAVCD
jgi:hypothetical protein